MSANHWTVLDIAIVLTDSGFIIAVKTDIPCHLYLRWSYLQPWAHKKAVISRGLMTMTDIRFCFDVYVDNEQEEAGDTILHSFVKEPWAYCETRWFYFHGLIADSPTPSTSAVFKKHRTPLQFNPIILEPWTIDEAVPPMTRIILEPWTS